MTRTCRHVVIGALGVTQILAWGSSYYLMAVLAAPIAADTGWSLTWIVGALSAGLLVAGLVSPFVGRRIGQVGGRGVLAVSAILLAIGLGLLRIAPNLPVFVFAWLVIGVGMGAGLYDPAFATLGRLYGKAARPAITTLTLWGGFASTVCWPLSAYLVEHVGWRGACLFYAAVQIFVSLPLIVALVPTPPELPPVAEGADVVADGSLSQVERRAFLVLAAVVTLAGITTSIVSVHLLTLLREGGLGLNQAVSLGMVIGPAQVGARVLEMAGGGRHHPLWTLAAAMAMIASGLLLLWAGFAIVAVALVLYGAGNGVFSIARGTLPLALFGQRHYGAIVGRLARPSLFAQAVAPSAGAVVIAHHGASSTLALLAGLAVANVALVLALFQASRGLRTEIRTG